MKDLICIANPCLPCTLRLSQLHNSDISNSHADIIFLKHQGVSCHEWH